MKGIILGISTNDYTSELKIGDLVCIDEEYEEFYTIVDINENFIVNNNRAKYIVSSTTNELMNFERNELSKSYLAIFDADKYYNENMKIKIGDIHYSDIRNMKFKVLLDLDLPISEINTITNDYLIGYIFDGNIINKQLDMFDTQNYFKLNYENI